MRTALGHVVCLAEAAGGVIDTRPRRNQLAEYGCFFHGEQWLFVGDAELLDCLV